MKVLLDTSVGITNYLDSYYKVKIIGKYLVTLSSVSYLQRHETHRVVRGVHWYAHTKIASKDAFQQVFFHSF